MRPLRAYLIIGLYLFFLPLGAYADTGVPDFLSGQKKGDPRAVVSVYVEDRSKREITQATGFVIDGEGLILTNSRIISKWLEDVEYDLIIRTKEGETLPLYRLIAYNQRLDIAIFKINAEGLIAARLPDGSRTAEYIKRAIARYKKMIRTMGRIPPEGSIPAKGKIAGMPPMEVIEKPLDAESHYLRGLTYARSNRYAEAIDEYRKALEIEHGSADVYINLGLAYYKIDSYLDAIDAYNQALRLRPGSKSICNKLGTIYLILGKYPEAIKAFKEALSIDDKDPTSHFNLAIANFLKGDKDSAWQEYVVLKGLNTGLAGRLRELLY